MHLRRAHLAAQQRTKPDFKLDEIRPRLRRPTRLTHDDVVQFEVRRRQDARVDAAVDVHGQPGQPAGFFLEMRPVMTPIDHERGDQRRHERHNDGNGQSEQRRLHVEFSLMASRTGARPPEPCGKASTEMHARSAAPGGICGRYCVDFLGETR